MPRAMLELRRALPPIPLYPMPVQPQAMGRFSSARILAAEYIKLLGAWAGVSHVMRQTASTVSRSSGAAPWG